LPGINSFSMKSMMLTGIRKMEMIEVPEPVIVNPGDVKIKMSVVGVCGSDVHYFTKGKIGSQVVQYPFAVGHEGAGVVAETGKGVTKVKPGDIIAVEPSMPCGECDQCLSGRPNTCRRLLFLGCPGQASGCMSEYIVMPEASCLPLHNGLNADHGVISEPLAIGVYSVKTSVPLRGKNIAILGFGPIGMSVLLAARAEGAGKIFVTDKISERLVIARKEMADIALNPTEEDIVNKILDKEPLGVDVVFECCGQQDAFDQGVDLLKPGGKIMVVGIPEFDKWIVAVDKTRRKEITIQYVRRQAGCTEKALEMMQNKEVDVSGMVTHRFHFTKAQEAFDLVAGYRDGVMKAMIDF
jgi:L-iditol 2-dehydrogenase